MATKKQQAAKQAAKTGRRPSATKGGGDWYTEAMSKANMAVARAHGGGRRGK